VKHISSRFLNFGSAFDGETAASTLILCLNFEPAFRFDSIWMLDPSPFSFGSEICDLR